MLRLSVLDQSTVVTGRSPDTSIRESLALAKHCEALGYTRYWCAEHHNSASQAGTAPEILISAIAATTSRIRIGSAGVMLPHYSSLKVAEQFRVLDAIAPGRIDLGLGRAPGSDGRTAYRAEPTRGNRSRSLPRPGARSTGMAEWRKTGGRPSLPRHLAQPGGPTTPEVWMFGSSDYGAQVAAYFGLPFCFAHFITDGRGVEQALALYRETYRPSARHPEPYAALCVWAMAADTQAKPHGCSPRARCGGLAATAVYIQPCPRLRKRQRSTYTEANSPASSGCAHARSTERRSSSATSCATLAAQHGVEEIAILTTLHDPEARRHSYTLLAKEFGSCSSS